MRKTLLEKDAQLCVSQSVSIDLKRLHGKTVVFMDIHEQKEKKREHARDEGPWLFFISILLETPICLQMFPHAAKSYQMLESYFDTYLLPINLRQNKLP